MAAQLLVSKKDVKSQNHRRHADFPPTVWEDHFTSFNSEVLKLDQKVEEEIQNLKEVVKNVLTAPTPKPSQKLNLIDSLQRLGVANHFQSEIQDLLDQVNRTCVGSFANENDHSLQWDALLFRLLRQQGYKASTDIFKKYTYDDRKFKESLAEDVRGLLSLYEAAYFGVHGEDILDEALNFSKRNLEAIVGNLSYPLSAEVNYALKHPLRRGMPRLEARHFMSIYKEDPSHSDALLTFAKLNYNTFQKLHQAELKEVSGWWKDLDFPSILPFARDRIVECYFWALNISPEPQYSILRRFMAKVIQMASVLDDIYDVYGTPEEIRLLTDAIDRWDICAQDQLPDYLKFYYQKVLRLYADFERENDIESESFRMLRAKDGMKGQAKAYFGEANWFHDGHIPTIDGYYQYALPSTCYRLFSVTAFLGMGDVIPDEAFDWIFTKPKILHAIEIIGRLMNDIVSHKFEQVRGHIASAMECYIKQYRVSEEEARTALEKRVDDAWKDINECCLKPIEFSMAVLSSMVNLARASHVTYREEDGFTITDGETKRYITSLVVDPVTLGFSFASLPCDIVK